MNERKNLVEIISLPSKAAYQDIAAGCFETVDVTVDRYLLASYDYTKAKGYILSAGDYYFTIGDNAHDALNIAAENATGMTDFDGKPVEGCGQTYRWSYDDVDTKTYVNPMRANGSPTGSRMPTRTIGRVVPSPI